MDNIVRLLLGLALLAFGRRLFWFFIGVAGFVIGLYLASRFITGVPNWALLLIAIVVGLIGAGLVVAVQGFAIGLAGFLAGGYFVMNLLQIVGWQQSGFAIVLYILGGIVGAVLTLVLFDWALILLSSLAGASMVVQSLNVGQPAVTLVFVILFVIGVVIQAALQRAMPPRTRPARSREAH